MADEYQKITDALAARTKLRLNDPISYQSFITLLDDLVS